MKKMILFSLVLLGATACCGGQKPVAATAPTQTEAAPTQTAAETSSEQTPDKGRMSGAYGNSRALNEEEKALFASVTADLKGVVYTPESVSTQVVAGLNYKFLCSAHTVGANSQTYKAEVVVFKPLPNKNELPRITSITKVGETE